MSAWAFHSRIKVAHWLVRGWHRVVFPDATVRVNGWPLFCPRSAGQQLLLNDLGQLVGGQRVTEVGVGGQYQVGEDDDSDALVRLVPHELW